MPRLLLVEDAPDAALIVERLGRRMGLEVTHRADVASAWDCVRQAPPDLILLDLNLPGERGEALCRRVRAAPDTAGLPIALFVHWGCPEDVASGLDAGADYVVSKDLLARPAAWQARLREILGSGDGLAPIASIRCQRNDLLPQPPLQGMDTLNRALHHPLVRQLGPDVVRLVLRRAVRCAGNGTAPGAGEADRWLQRDGLAVDVRLAATAPAGAVAALAAAVAEQLQRLLGTEASLPVREALAAAVGRPSGWPGEPMKAAHAILLVEDNPADIEITRRALRESAAPVELIVVRDGQEAVDYLLRQGSHAGSTTWRLPDLVLLDLNLPRLTGREVLERLRATEEFRSVPVVVLTTSKRPEDVRDVYGAGANTYIEKPQDFRQFIEVLRTIRHYWLDTALLPPGE